MLKLFKDPTLMFKGYRTYVMVVVAVVLGVLQAFGIYTVPGVIWVMLGAGGLGFLRSAVNTVAAMVTEMRDKTKGKDDD